MKKLLDKWISISLIKRIIGGLALGIILGLLVPKATGISLFGSVFVGALKATASCFRACHKFFMSFRKKSWRCY